MCSDVGTTSRVCAMYSFTGMLFTLYVGVMLSTQSFFITGIEDVDEAKSNAFGAMGMFAATFALSMYGISRTSTNEKEDIDAPQTKDLHRLDTRAMGAALSSVTTYLSVSLCDGSNRKLIAGWWYTILFTSIIQISLAMWAMSSRGGTEAFISLWSAIVLLVLCIGGTIIMRKFQSSVFVGFFMGSVVAASQMFFMLFLIIFAYIEDRLAYNLPVDGERLTGFLFLVQSIMLGSFAAILAAHRSEILDQKVVLEEDAVMGYEAPKQRTVV